jgi:hypothetical protein
MLYIDANVISGDNTIISKSCPTKKESLEGYSGQTPSMHESGSSTCTLGYAVSYRGAQKIILASGNKGDTNFAGNNGIEFLCRNDSLDIKYFVVKPVFFFNYRTTSIVTKNNKI